MKTVPFTISAALIFWGHHTGYLIPAVLMGIVIELSRVIKTRWDPSLDQVNKLSDTCMVCLAGSIIYFVSMEIETALGNILRYLPVFILPLINVQEYSATRDIDIRSLYLFKKRIRGKTEAKRINLSFGFIIICLISAAAVNDHQFPYYPVALSIMAVTLFFQRPRGSDIRIWGPAIIVVAIMGFFLQEGFHHAQKAIFRRAWYRMFHDRADPIRGTTALGRIGRLKLSNKIIFRVIPPEKDHGGTYLLKEAAYTFLSGNVWTASQNKFEPIPLSENDGFMVGWQPVSSHRETEKQQAGDAVQPLPKLTIQTRMRKSKGVLRTPENALEISGNTLSDVTTNGLGTFLANDVPGFMIYDIRYGDPGTKIRPPDKLDLLIPDREKALFQTLAVELGFGQDQSTPKEVLPKIKKHFLANFSYTLDLKTGNTTSPITEFMTRTRAGHCEYFATATVLLLRAAGIPARYVSGYMAFEKSAIEDKIVVRSKHAHAWTEVFVNGRWIFFDTTPPSWAAEEKSHLIQTVIPDLFSLIGYGLALLRWGNPENQKKLLWLLVPLGFLIIRRLLRKDKKKKNHRDTRINSPSGLMPDTPDFYIKKLEEKLIRSGFLRNPHETYEQFFIRIRDKAFSQQDIPSLMTVIRLHKQLRFGPPPIASQKQVQLKTEIDRLVQTL